MIKFLSSQHDFWTIVLKRIRLRHKRLKFVLKWFVFYNSKTVAEVSSIVSSCSSTVMLVIAKLKKKNFARL